MKLYLRGLFYDWQKTQTIKSITMKNLNLGLLALLFSLTLLTSCRTEDDLAIDPPAEETLAANSRAAELMSRTSLNDGSNDNIIDNASCFNIQLPVTVTVNGIQVVVNSSSDYQTIEDIFDADNNDLDILDISFPITVVFSDYTTTTVNSYLELLALVVQCPAENAADDDIECIDFQYPITASVFNVNNELIDIIEFNSDYELYNFIDDLDDFAAVAINFPISVILADGSTSIVNTIAELEAAIESAENTCDEDDDNDYNDDDCDNCTTNDLQSVLVNCANWLIDELELNDVDLEGQYVSYSFSFASDGTVTVAANGVSLSGTYSITGSGNNIQFVLNIPNLSDVSGTWYLHEIELESGQTEVKFERSNDDELTFVSNC